MELNVGGNFRRYSLFTDGTILDEDPTASSPADINPKRITIDEYGMYAQAGKQIGILKLQGSMRYDKNQNFDGLFTPRISAVLSITDNSNIRVSYQTGFRNPDIQTQYIYFPSGSGILLGSTKANAERYGIHNGGSWTQASYEAYRAGGSTDQSLLVEANIKYVKPEQLQSFEIGYKGLIFKKILIDYNLFYNTYTNFMGDQKVYSKNATTHQGQTIAAGTLWDPYVNAPEKVKSLGTGVSVTYNFFKNYTLTGNYSYQQYSAPEEVGGFNARFNMPKNKYTVSVGTRKISNKVPIGFNLNYRWQQTFQWSSSYGNWEVPEYGVLDANISYKVSKIRTMFKLGGTNLGGGDYRPNYGSSFVGQQYYLSITFDQFLK